MAPASRLRARPKKGDPGPNAPRHPQSQRAVNCPWLVQLRRFLPLAAGLSPAHQCPPCSWGQLPKPRSHLGGLCHLSSLPPTIFFHATYPLPARLSELLAPGLPGITPQAHHKKVFTIRPQLDPFPEGIGGCIEGGLPSRVNKDSRHAALACWPHRGDKLGGLRGPSINDEAHRVLGCQSCALVEKTEPHSY